jgi:hypothetical protein
MTILTDRLSKPVITVLNKTAIIIIQYIQEHENNRDRAILNVTGEDQNRLVTSQWGTLTHIVE